MSINGYGKGNYAPKDRYILFMLTVEFAFMNVYLNGQPNPQRWQAAD